MLCISVAYNRKRTASAVRIFLKRCKQKISRVLYMTIIYLVRLSPAASSDLPESTTGRRMAFFSVLLRMEFTCARSVTTTAVVSYTAFPPLPSIKKAVYFCCTGLGVTSTGRYPASCPAKPGLSSSEPFRLFSRDYLAWLRKCYSSTFFCTCKEISFYYFTH